MAEAQFKHFKPIGEVTPKKVLPNFVPLGVDVYKPYKNIPRFEETAVSAGLRLAKTVVRKVAGQFFETKLPSTEKQLTFPTPPGDEMPVLGFSDLGTAVYSNLVILGDEYEDNNGNVIASFDTIRNDNVLMEVVRENNVVITEIQGRDGGDIIERISAKSPRIRFALGIYSTKSAGNYPYDAVVELLRALKSNKALRIESWFLEAMGIYNIAILKDTIKQSAGEQDSQKFEFEAIADSPLILKLAPST